MQGLLRNNSDVDAVNDARPPSVNQLFDFTLTLVILMFGVCEIGKNIDGTLHQRGGSIFCGGLSTIVVRISLLRHRYCSNYMKLKRIVMKMLLSESEVRVAGKVASAGSANEFGHVGSSTLSGPPDEAEIRLVRYPFKYTRFEHREVSTRIAASFTILL